MDSFAAVAKVADRRHFTSIQLEKDAAQLKDQSGVATESFNPETASDDHGT